MLQLVKIQNRPDKRTLLNIEFLKFSIALKIFLPSRLPRVTSKECQPARSQIKNCQYTVALHSI
jgi:hypothetical protein